MRICIRRSADAVSPENLCFRAVSPSPPGRAPCVGVKNLKFRQALLSLVLKVRADGMDLPPVASKEVLADASALEVNS